MKDMDGKGYDFCRIHGYLQPSDSWDIENISLAYEHYRMKDNGKGKELCPSFFVGEHQITEKEGDIVHDNKVPFGSYPK